MSYDKVSVDEYQRLTAENERLRAHMYKPMIYQMEENAALLARTRALEAALEAIRRRILRDDPEPEEVEAEIASGRTINDVYMIAKAALTEPTPPAGGQVMPRVKGVPFRCSCGCNVFTKQGDRYSCNGCDAMYVGSPTEPPAPGEGAGR